MLYCEGGDGGFEEEGAEFDGGAEVVFDLGEHGGGEQGVAAELEEVVVDADALRAERLRADPGQDLLRRALRRDELSGRRTPSTAGSAARSTLPFGSTGTPRSHEHRRHHVLRQPLRNHHEPQPSAAINIAATTYAISRAPHPRPSATTTADDTVLIPQRRLDLTQLDPKPTHLHLKISRPKNSSLPSGTHRARSPCDTTAPPAANGSATNRSAVKSARSR